MSVIDEIKTFIDKPVNGKQFKLLNDNQSSSFTIDMDSIPIKFVTDFQNYFYASSPTVDMNLCNLTMIYKKKTVQNIFMELSNMMDNPKITLETNISDRMHIFQNSVEFTKFKIDYEEYEQKLISKRDLQKQSSLFNIPKELLLSPLQIIKLIINEIKKVNRSKEYKHIIVPDDYSLIVTLFIKNHEMKFKLILDKNTYPFMPPKLEYISPNIKLELLLSLINLPLLKLENWISTISLEFIIINIANQLEDIIDSYISNELAENQDLDIEITKILSITKATTFDNIFKLEIPKKSSQTMQKYWSSGTGYGSNDNNNNWDINKFVKQQELINDDIVKSLSNINILIKPCNKINSAFMNFIIKKCEELNMLELVKQKEIYSEIFYLLNHLYEKNNSQYNDIFTKIYSSIVIMMDELNMLFKTNNDERVFLQLACLIDLLSTKYKSKLIDENIIVVNNEDYCSVMKPLQFMKCSNNPDHLLQIKDNVDAKSVMRMLSEISSFKNNLPLNSESSIWVRIPKDNIQLFTFMISGPKDTPYENGLFEFHACFPKTYPNDAPKVLLKTTGNGKVRFNPNLYNCGKVCLSLLGTWQGHESEKWNAKTSTFLQVLISIQSLILVEQPFFNEPGWEKTMHTEKGKKDSKAYNDNLLPSTIKFAMIDMIKNPPTGYEDVVKLHFKMKKDEILSKIEIWQQKAPPSIATLIDTNKRELIELLKNL